MQFSFPKIQTTRTREQQAQKVIDEVHEYFEAESVAEQDKEAIDILHTVETFLRVHFHGRESLIDHLILLTAEKNEKRGYYNKPCF